MHQRREPVRGTRVRQPEALALGGAQHALIARLPAAVGIKDRAIQDDAVGSAGNDRRLAFSAIGIMSKDFFGHGQNSCPSRVPRFGNIAVF